MTVARALRLLDVDLEASDADLKASYRDLVRVWHPDRFEGDARLRAKAADRLSDINAAYRFLQASPHQRGRDAARRTTPMPDRRKRPRPAAPPARRRPSVATIGLAAAMLLTIGLAGAPFWWSEAAPAVARIPAAVVETTTPAPPPSAARWSLEPAARPAPEVPAARSPFSRDLDRILSRAAAR